MLELRDVGLSPGLEAAGIPRTLELVADGWVGIDHTPSDGKCHQATQRLEHIALWMWLEQLEQFGDVPRLHHGEAFVPMFGAKTLEQRAPHPLRCCRKPPERLGIHVGRNDSLHGARVVAVGADQRRCAGERLLICRHELRRPGQAWQRCALVGVRSHKIAINSYPIQRPLWTTLRTQVGHLATSEKCQKLLRPFPRGYAVAWTQTVGRDMPNPAHWRSTFRGTGISFEEPREGQHHKVCSKDLGSNW